MAASLTVTSKNLTVFRTCVLTGSSGTSTSVADTTVKQDGSGSNFGSATSMDVQVRSPGRDHRIYLRFDLTMCNPAISSSANVGAATLRLWVSGLPSSCRTYDVFKAPSGWEEGTITGLNQPFGTTENNPASDLATDTASLGSSPCGFTSAGYVTWNVTSDIQAFVSGTSSNYGWMIRDDDESASAIQGVFSTKELANLSQSPQLVVNYP
jgi:hypothetical protein